MDNKDLNTLLDWAEQRATQKYLEKQYLERKWAEDRIEAKMLRDFLFKKVTIECERNKAI